MFHGRTTGFYRSFRACVSHVIGYSGGMNVCFSTIEEAHSAWLKYWAKASLWSTLVDLGDVAFMGYMAHAMGDMFKPIIYPKHGKEK